MLSTSSKTATIAEIENTGAISGAVTVQHYLSTSGWQNLSPSVTGLKVADWQQYFPITGLFTGASTGSGLTSSPSMFVSNGTTLVAYPPTGGSNQALIERTKGYYTQLFAQSVPITLKETGNPNQGKVDFSLVGGSGGGVNDGWNLVGNPFASPILWSMNTDAWLRSGVSPVIAINENKIIEGQTINQFSYFHPLLGNVTINEGQGFWVQTFNTTPSLSITEKAKTIERVTYPQPVADLHYLTITLQQGLKMDPAYILFTEEGTDAFDNLYDAVKKRNEGMFNFSTKLEAGTDLAVNTLSNNFCSKTIKLNLQNTSAGAYSFSFAGIESLTALGKISLEDRFTGTSTALSSAPYTFSITADPASYGADRFALLIERQQLDTTSPQVTGQDVCAQGNALLTITNVQPGVEYTAVNDSDQIISNVVEATTSTVSLELITSQLNSGMNHVRVRAGFAGCTVRLLTSEANVNYTPSFTITVPTDVSVCSGDAATLQASGVPDGGHYKWFDENNTEITSTQGASLVTAPVSQETTFQVAGVMTNGCESEKTTVHVQPVTLEKPAITVSKDTLFVQSSGTYQWKKNGQPITGATQSYLKVQEENSYTVVVAVGNCVQESDPFNYVNEGCRVDVTTPQAKAEGACGADQVTVTISATETGVEYTAMNPDNQKISSTIVGNGDVIRLQLSSGMLAPGVNQIRIRANLPGCTYHLLASEINYMNTSSSFVVQAPDTVRTCKGSTALLNASGAPVGGSYLWYDLQGNVIPGATGSSYVTGSITEATLFFVSAVQNSGCESLRKPIHVMPGLFPIPKISVDNGLLKATGSGVFQWKRNGEIIIGASSSAISPQLSGTYIVIVSQGNCSQESEPFDFTVTAIAQGYSGEFSLEAYPVPATANNLTISVQSPKSDKVFIEVIDSKGTTVFHNGYTVSELALGVPVVPNTGFSEGVYVVIATQGNVQVRRRIIIKN